MSEILGTPITRRFINEDHSGTGWREELATVPLGLGTPSVSSRTSDPIDIVRRLVSTLPSLPNGVIVWNRATTSPRSMVVNFRTVEDAPSFVSLLQHSAAAKDLGVSAAFAAGASDDSIFDILSNPSPRRGN